MIERRGSLTSGLAVFPSLSRGTATVEEVVHDGDTVKVGANGSFGVRFLGVDTPEVSFQLPQALEPGRARFSGLDDPRWEQFLSDALSDQYGKFVGPDGRQGNAQAILGKELFNDLSNRLKPGCASSHFAHAQRAHSKLVDLVKQDVIERVQQGKTFRFFMAFAYEVMDGYGRFLCFLHRDDSPQERRRRTSYNAWMLEAGLASPYLIWPNIDPFRTRPTLTEAVPAPDDLASWIEGAPRLVEARRFVRAAREGSRGLFEPLAGNGPLLLLPFELRYLAQRRPPSRYVLDLSKVGTADAKYILKPTEYYLVPNWEDRLFVDAHFVPLFEKKGYQLR